MENAKEYFCWLRVVAADTLDRDALRAGHRLPEDALVNLSGERAAEYLRTTCPRVTWHEEVYIKRPPAPPVRRSAEGRFERKTRAVLDFAPLTTVHLEPPVQPYPLEIDMNPIFGDRGDALRWLETEAGMAFSTDVQALTLLCITVVDGRLQVTRVPAGGTDA